MGRSAAESRHAPQAGGRALLHLLCRAAREGQQKHVLVIGAMQEQIGYPVSQRVGLAGACACNHQKRSQVWLGLGAVLHGLALSRSQFSERIGTSSPIWTRLGC
jgi:hypothetical protein